MKCTDVNCCGKQTIQQGSSFIGKDFDFCLPFGARLFSKEGVVQYEEPTAPIPDGEYSTFTVRNGCIVSAGQMALPVYTSTPCAPVPVPCDCDGQGTAVIISPDASNLSRIDASGRLITNLSIRAGSGISVTGLGTVASPYIISLTGSGAADLITSSDTALVAGNDGIVVTGSGTGDEPFTVSHKVVFDSATTVNGIMFDRYGHCISSAHESTTGLVNGVLGSETVTVETDVNTGIAKVSLPEPLHPVNDTIVVGDYAFEIDKYNRIYRVAKVTPDPGGDSSETTTTNATSFVLRAPRGSTTEVAQFTTSISCVLFIEVFLTQIGTFSIAQTPAIRIDGTGIVLNPVGSYAHMVGITDKIDAGTHTIRAVQDTGAAVGDLSSFIVHVTMAARL